MYNISYIKESRCPRQSGGRRCRDRVVIGFSTTCGISAYHHNSCEFEPCSWRDILDTTLCNSLSVTCDRSVVFSRVDIFIVILSIKGNSTLTLSDVIKT
jgi:hypothetical protein